MLIVVEKVLIIVAISLVGTLIVCNIKSHNEYKLSDFVKYTVAYDWLVMVVLFIYLVYKLVTM